jgi:c(7)-type cytochrome triheme protein
MKAQKQIDEFDVLEASEKAFSNSKPALPQAPSRTLLRFCALSLFVLAYAFLVVAVRPELAPIAHAKFVGKEARLLPLPGTYVPSAKLRIVSAHVGSELSTFSAQQSMSERDFSRFSHRTPQHSSMACSSCHNRTNNSPVPALSGHKDCTSCHLAQFVTPNIPMCAICHTNLNSSNPPVKNFPRLASFNVIFDHAQHSRGDARPANDCAACHLPLRRGIAKTIPAGFTGNPGGHSQCYTCHSPGSTSNGRDIASCGTCHQPGSFRRTPTTGRAFQVNFSHADHAAGQNLSCNDCHTLRAGLPQARQVSSPIAEQHFASTRAQSCMSCHNGRRAFGDANFGDCKRCHTNGTFRMGS